MTYLGVSHVWPPPKKKSEEGGVPCGVPFKPTTTSSLKKDPPVCMLLSMDTSGCPRILPGRKVNASGQMEMTLAAQMI